MADEVRTYNNTREIENSGTGSVAIVALVLVALAALVLGIMYWNNFFGTSNPVVEKTTIIDNSQPSTNTVITKDTTTERTITPADSQTSQSESTTQSSTTTETNY